MSEIKHTALPWRTDRDFDIEHYRDGNLCSIRGEDGYFVAAVHNTVGAEEAQANAAFIVTACNNFYALRDVCQLALVAHNQLIDERKKLIAALHDTMTQLRRLRDMKPELWDAIVDPELCNQWDANKAIIAQVLETGGDCEGTKQALRTAIEKTQGD